MCDVCFAIAAEADWRGDEYLGVEEERSWLKVLGVGGERLFGEKKGKAEFHDVGLIVAELLQLLPALRTLTLFRPFLRRISVVADGCDCLGIGKAWWDLFCLGYDFLSSGYCKLC